MDEIIQWVLHGVSNVHLMILLLFCIMILGMMSLYVVRLRKFLYTKELEIKQKHEDLERVRAIVDNDVVGCYIRDVEGKVLYANERYLSLVGRTIEEVIGFNLLDWVYIEDREYMEEAMEVTNTSERINFAHFRYVRPDGTIVWTKALGFILKGHQPPQVLVMCWEVGKDKFTWEQLKNIMEPMAHLLDSLGEGMIATDEKGYIILANIRAEELLGCSRSEVYKRRMDSIFYLEETDGKRIDGVFPRLCRSYSLPFKEVPVLLLNKNKEKIPVFLSSSPLKDGEGNFIACMVIFKDASMYVKHQEELLRLERLETLSLISSGIAHDFNNLLSGILGNIEFIKVFCDRYQNEELKKNIEHIEKAATKSKHLVNKLMVFSKKDNSRRERFSLIPLLEDNIRFILSGSEIELVMKVEGDLCPVYADKLEIEQAFQNIILNAREAMRDKGTLTVKVYMSFYEKEILPIRQGRYIVVEITDTGCGIPEDVLPRIFDPYFTTKENGTGLGLAATYQSIKGHGGHIEVTSMEGKGTTFLVYIPCVEESSSKETVLKKQKDFDIDLSSKKILVIDDDETFGEMIKEMVCYLGGEVRWFKRGEDGLSHYLAEKGKGNLYHLIMVDISLSGPMSGWDVGKKILQHNPTATVVACTGNMGKDIKNMCITYGFRDVIFKPFTLIEFVGFLAKWIG